MRRPLILTESDLATIENALNVAARSCRDAARAHPDMGAAFAESADKYAKLGEAIAEADQITVERIP